MERIKEYQRRLESISEPVSDEEAEALATLFGPDDCHGLAWALVHLIETAPNGPFADRLPEGDNEWVRRLVERAERGE